MLSGGEVPDRNYKESETDKKKQIRPNSATGNIHTIENEKLYWTGLMTSSNSLGTRSS